MKYIRQMYDIQTDGEILTLYCKHVALFEFLLLTDFIGCFYIYLSVSLSRFIDLDLLKRVQFKFHNLYGCL